MKTLEDRIAEVKAKNLTPAHEAKMIEIFTKKANKKQNNKKWNERLSNDNTKSTCNPNELGEINKANAMRNLPSSMR